MAKYTLADCLKMGIKSLSLPELKELEQILSSELSKVRYGIMNDSVTDYEPQELEELISSKLLAVQNRRTALNIRS